MAYRNKNVINQEPVILICFSMAIAVLTGDLFR